MNPSGTDIQTKNNLEQCILEAKRYRQCKKEKEAAAFIKQRLLKKRAFCSKDLLPEIFEKDYSAKHNKRNDTE